MCGEVSVEEMETVGVGSAVEVCAAPDGCSCGDGGFEDWEGDFVWDGVGGYGVS